MNILWQRGWLVIAAAWPGMAVAEELPIAPVSQFVTLCGVNDKGVERLPGEDVAVANAPSAFANDLERARSSRVVKIDDRYAMRAIVPSSADPEHTVLVKCALNFGGVSFANAVDQASQAFSSKPSAGTTGNGLKYASYVSGMASFAAFEEPEGRISIYKIDFLMTNIPPKYLKKGAKPIEAPTVQ